MRRPPRRDLPPPLPPEERTVGQVVAETIRFYGEHFWPSLALGLGLATLDVVVVPLPELAQFAVAAGAGELLMTASFIGASVLVSGAHPSRRDIWKGFLCGFLVWPPAALLPLAFAFFGNIYVALVGFALPSIAWLAYVGLSVPVAVIEGGGVRRALGRAMELARADYVHVFGSLTTLVFVYFLTREMLFFLLRGSARNEAYVAAFLADTVISPMLFLGSALLYIDQTARLEKVRPPAPDRPDSDGGEPDSAGADAADDTVPSESMHQTVPSGRVSPAATREQKER